MGGKKGIKCVQKIRKCKSIKMSVGRLENISDSNNKAEKVDWILSNEEFNSEGLHKDDNESKMKKSKGKSSTNWHH